MFQLLVLDKFSNGNKVRSQINSIRYKHIIYIDRDGQTDREEGNERYRGTNRRKVTAKGNKLIL